MSQPGKKLLFVLAAVLTLVLPPLRRGLWAAILALLLAWLARKAVAALESRGLPRRWAAILVALAGTAAGVLLLWGMAWAVWSALSRAACLLPDTAQLFPRLRALAARLPDGLSSLGTQAVATLEQRSTQLREQLLLRTARLSAQVLTQVPHWLFFWLIVGSSSFYAAAHWRRLRPLLLRAVPEEWRPPLGSALVRLGHGAGRWLAVQGRLMLFQFLLVTAGLLLLGQRSAGAVAALAALSDALPLLGTGAVLLPLALLRALEGAPLTALGLCVLTVCCSVLRAIQEPRLVGRQAGLSPFFTLLGVYLGAECFGLGGMAGALIVASALGSLEPEKES
jgi:predicted PurR-regulated permease PerM